ncbi:CIC11C00000002542 [Sungouiella intermedia]|uniref:CIC11C00000002542 n=1 Tax=Sungouiella intermedia TaxID=45354 RepID=A0A1L0DQH3_9ASCO|nr:CIC11C00000002542 [[Candida] intermedia]
MVSIMGSQKAKKLLCSELQRKQTPSYTTLVNKGYSLTFTTKIWQKWPARYSRCQSELFVHDDLRYTRTPDRR